MQIIDHSIQLDEPRSLTSRPDLYAMMIAVFILTAAPRMRLPAGGLPLYVVDIFIAAALVFSQGRQRPVSSGSSSLGRLVMTYFCFMMISEVLGAFRYQMYLDSLYMLIRSCLAVSMFFNLNRIIETNDDLKVIIKAALLGLIVTSGIMICCSLPMTRGLVVKYLFSHPLLEPHSAHAVAKFGGAAEQGMRGRSLVGVSNMSGAFIVTLWPLAFLMYLWNGISQRWKVIALIGCLLAPFGAVMTYSRAAIVSLAFVLLTFGGLGTGGMKRNMILFASLIVACFSVIGWGSHLFFFNRIVMSTEAAIENPVGAETNAERVMSYVEPYGFMRDHPEYLFVGEGSVRTKIDPALAAEVLGYDENMATHSAFAMTFYSYGMLAAFCNVFMLCVAFYTAYQNTRKTRDRSGAEKLRASVMLACLAGMLPWYMFGHGSVSQPRGAMFFFLVLGLPVVTSRLIDQEDGIDEELLDADY